jgi:hypothetical protein
MSRQQFSSSNNVGKILTLQKSGSTVSFDPSVSFIGSKRVSWRLDNGVSITQVAGNSIVYTGFTSDTSIREFELRTNSFKNIIEIIMNNDNLYGHIDLTNSNNLWNLDGNINFSDNIGITGITNPMMGVGTLGLSLSNYNLSNCNLLGNLNMTPISGDVSSFILHQNPNLTSITFSNTTNIRSQISGYQCNLIGNINIPFSGSSFQIQQNPNLTGITFTTPSIQSISLFNASTCNLTGTLDLINLSGIGGSFLVYSNTGLTNIIHAPSTNSFGAYWVYNSNLSGNFNLSMLSGIGGSFLAYSNPNLTGISHAYSVNNFTAYNLSQCNITGNLDLTMLPGLGGSFETSFNPNLTGITHTASTNSFSNYSTLFCNLIGNHDISMLTNIGGEISMSSNPLLTGITLTPASTRGLSIFNISSCDFQGTIDLTPFTGFGSTSIFSSSQIKINANSGITNVIFPESNGLYYRNITNSLLNAAFGMYSCSLGYIDFKPLSGSTLISGATVGIPRFELFGNGMTTAEVNHILSDFDLISDLNYSGWTATSGTTGGYINISSNSAPDGSSGGYNGTGATINLVAKGWTVITD